MEAQRGCLNIAVNVLFPICLFMVIFPESFQADGRLCMHRVMMLLIIFSMRSKEKFCT